MVMVAVVQLVVVLMCYGFLVEVCWLLVVLNKMAVSWLMYNGVRWLWCVRYLCCWFTNDSVKSSGF